VFQYAQTQSIVTVRQRFRTKFGKDLLVKNSIKQWYEKLQGDGCLCFAKRAISRLDREMLRRLWAEVDYRLDVYRVAKGGHVENL
jgi:hypothetical protein